MFTMEKRLLLQQILETLRGVEPEQKIQVYFQPPTNDQMVYPCIVFNRDRGRTFFANNKPYHHVKAYTVTVMDTDPDSDIPDLVARLPMTEHDRFFTNDNLNHDVFTIFF